MPAVSKKYSLIENFITSLLVKIKNQFNCYSNDTSMIHDRGRHFFRRQSRHGSESKSTERKAQTANNSFLNHKPKDSHLNEREKKFSIFLHKYGAKHRSSKPSNQNSRLEILYEHAKIQTAIKDKLRSEIRSKAYQHEKSQCTFNPKLNKKSRSMTKNEQKTQSIYQRGIQWSNLKIEKIKHERKIKLIEESEHSHQPNIEPLICNKKKMPNESCNNNNKKKMFQDLSILSFFERQETARQARTSRENQITHRHYSVHQGNISNKISSKGMTTVMLKKYKAQLHKELSHSMIKDDNYYSNKQK